MAHISEDSMDHGTLFGIKKVSIKFSFGDRGYNHTHDGSEDMNGAIHGRKNGVGEGRFSRI